MKFKKIFKVSKPIIAMIHINHKIDIKESLENAMKDVYSAVDGEVDGLMFENWGNDYINRFAGSIEKNYITKAMKEASSITDLPLGINILPLDFEADFDIAKEVGAKFVQLDTLVDTVITDYKNKFTLSVKPKDVIKYKNASQENEIALLVNIQTKHYITIPKNKKLETSAIEAFESGADAVVVTGKKTGIATPTKKALKIKNAITGIPILIGSGLDAENASELLTISDGAIVGTSLKINSITSNPIDVNKVKALMEIVKKVR
jgi:membrane complex biogenesis BtpA family protein